MNTLSLAYQTEQHVETLSDAQILRIMHAHNTYRAKKTTFDEMWRALPSDHVPSTEERELYSRYVQPLMTDKQFLTQLRKIVPPAYPVITTSQVAAVYNLRVKYEYLPVLKNGKQPVYTDLSVRMQVRANKKKSTNGITPLSAEEQQAVFGKVFDRVHYFRLEAILKHELGRWPTSRREAEKPRRPRGRPKAGVALQEQFSKQE